MRTAKACLAMLGLVACGPETLLNRYPHMFLGVTGGNANGIAIGTRADGWTKVVGAGRTCLRLWRPVDQSSGLLNLWLMLCKKLQLASSGSSRARPPALLRHVADEVIGCIWPCRRTR